jgi:two-component system, LytTR family, response regulator
MSGTILLRSPPWLRDFALGVAYWLVFVLLLEPGNMVAAHRAGHGVDVEREAARLAGAALLGGCGTPLVLWLVRRHPIWSLRAWRAVGLHGTNCAALAVALIVVSCPLAAWVLGGPEPLEAIPSQLAANWALLVYGLATLTAAAHAVRFLREGPAARQIAHPLAQVAARSGRRTVLVDLAAVDWIEAQGNYVALHVGGGVHLVRSTLGAFEARLDPARFARIHRRAIVALDRVTEVTTLDGGDADLRLRDGLTLRLSRSYRSVLKSRL